MRATFSWIRDAPRLWEPACMLCGQTYADPDICGPKQLEFGICAHVFCMAFSNGLFQQARIVDRTAEVTPEDVQRVIQEAEHKHCFICGELGAPITCAETGCEQSFHLSCTRQGECVTQYFGEYSSFCQQHSPKQAAEAAPEQNTNCIICMEPVEDKKSYLTLVCPACKHAWFHRACIQGQAIRAGVNCFQCPLCRDTDAFLSDMLVMGIRIPLSGPTWEDDNAYASLGLRHERCDASDCLYPLGREQAEGEGPWELLLCSSCAAEGTHRRCSYLSNDADAWECKACAGVGTASSVNSEVTGPSTLSQRGLLPSHDSTVPESSSSSTASQAATGPVHSSQVPESGSQSSQPGTAQMDEDIHNHPRGCHGSSHADRCPTTSSRQRASRSSRASLAVGSCRSRLGERTRTRSRTPIQSQVLDSHSHPRRLSRRSQAPAARAESGSQHYTRRGALRPSGDSPAAGRRRQTRQQAQTRSRSPVERRPAESRGQLHRHHRSQSRRRGQSRTWGRQAENAHSQPQRCHRSRRT
ncbi:PHD finger protein 7-like [Coturnix japonica]|uniref:PHD finger protein 7-like n=1 Tax=Coturnix japonica TaxID=93934 RepID=UPI0013A5EAC9|nr:PHD finger protein 7-like [Coturnix japonica]